MRHELEVLSQVVTWVVGPLSLIVAVAGYVRQWPASYRRVTGWTLVALGTVLAISSAGWLIASHLPASRGQGLVVTLACAAGVLVAGIGVVRVTRAPVDPDVQVLRAISAA